jgi:hypothetical protein
MAVVWDFRCYVNVAGSNEIRLWFDKQPSRFKANLFPAFKRCGNSTPNSGCRSRFVGSGTNAPAWEKFVSRLEMFSKDLWDFVPTLHSRWFSAPSKKAENLCQPTLAQLA